MGKAADLVERAVYETLTLTYYGFPDIHWQKIRTNNPLERITNKPAANRKRRSQATALRRAGEAQILRTSLLRNAARETEHDLVQGPLEWRPRHPCGTR